MASPKAITGPLKALGNARSDQNNELKVIMLRATPFAAGPLFFKIPLFLNSVRFGFAGSPFGAMWGPWCLLFHILGAILASREYLGGHFSTSETPWDVILTVRDHPGGPWEQQDGHEVANNRMLVDLGVISGLVYVSL